MKNISALSLSLLAVTSVPLLSSCGGGGGGGSSSPAPAPTPVAASAPAQGFFQGTSSGGQIIDTLILEDGSYYTIYGTAESGALAVGGIILGSGSSDLATSKYSGSGNDFISGTSGTYYSATYSGTYVVNSSLSETINVASTPASVVSVTADTGAVPAYVYNSTPSLTNVTGTWSGGELNGETVNYTVTSTGGFSGQNSGGCTFTGTLVPRASGKNVFDATITFGAAPCALPNASVTGIAIEYTLNSTSGTRQMLLTYENAANTVAGLFTTTQ